jgi:hypothetical protein
MKASQVLSALSTALGEKLKNYELRPREVGVRQKWTVEEIWAEVPREAIPEAVATLKSLGPLHISVISGHDAGEEIELLYHLAVGFGTEGGEVMVTLRTRVPKERPGRSLHLRDPSRCGDHGTGKDRVFGCGLPRDPAGKTMYFCRMIFPGILGAGMSRS